MQHDQLNFLCDFLPRLIRHPVQELRFALFSALKVQVSLLELRHNT